MRIMVTGTIDDISDFTHVGNVMACRLALID